MYRSIYAEILEGSPKTVRANERAAILHSISLLERAQEAGVNSREAIDALLFLRRLWEFFMVQLASDENRLPEKLRADLISIGLSMLREAERIKKGEVQDFTALKDISQTIADGLND
ncbi:MAG: flagellar biosynthesis regulator FlaF [Rhodomicrobium sp.]